ncbi:hypothetical protein [Krasilnikovia sp. MM14-A1259]|uniref:LppU/SCO3897 family protein n=1 Tax=Krasilnikovia sp. MM14-A1259 TaxID=3373539 RepID=UPI0038017470
MTSEGQHAGRPPAEATSGDGAEHFGADRFPPGSDGHPLSARSVAPPAAGSAQIPPAAGHAQVPPAAGRAQVPAADPNVYAPPPHATPNGGSPFVVPAVPPTGPVTEFAGGRPTSGAPGSDQPPPSAWAPPPPATPGPASERNPFDAAEEPHPYRSGTSAPLDVRGDIQGFAPGSPTRGMLGDPGDAAGEMHAAPSPFSPPAPPTAAASPAPGSAWSPESSFGRRSGDEPASAGAPQVSGFGPDVRGTFPGDERRTPVASRTDHDAPQGFAAFGDQQPRVPGATLGALPDAPPPSMVGDSGGFAARTTPASDAFGERVADNGLPIRTRRPALDGDSPELAPLNGRRPEDSAFGAAGADPAAPGGWNAGATPPADGPRPFTNARPFDTPPTDDPRPFGSPATFEAPPSDGPRPFGSPAAFDTTPADGLRPFGSPAAFDAPPVARLGSGAPSPDRADADGPGFAQRVPGASFGADGPPALPGSPGAAPGSAGPVMAEARRSVPQPRDPSEQSGSVTGSARPVSASASVPVASRVAPDTEEPRPAAPPQARVYGRPAAQADESLASVSPFPGRRVDEPTGGELGGPSQDLPPLGPKTPAPGGNRPPARATASARVAPQVAPESPGAPFQDSGADSAGRGRDNPLDRYGEDTTDMAGRNPVDKPYVPEPALPSMHARPPMVDGFPPQTEPDAAPQPGPDPRSMPGGVFPGAAARATVTPPGPDAAASWSGPADANSTMQWAGPADAEPTAQWAGPVDPNPVAPWSAPADSGPSAPWSGPADANPAAPWPADANPAAPWPADANPGPPWPTAAGADPTAQWPGQAGSDATPNWPGSGGQAVAAGDPGPTGTPDATPEKPETPHVRVLPVTVMVVLGAAIVLGIVFGIVWLISRGSGSGAAFSVSQGDCVKRAGDEAVKATCGDAGSYQVVSIVEGKDKCPDPGQPYVLNPTDGNKTQVLCLKPNG